MLRSRSRRCLLTVSIGCLVAMTGCARPFPERLNWYGHHPALYSLALGAAAQEALVRSMSGLGYYEYMGDAAYTLSTTGTCNRETLDTYLVKKERGCFLLGGPPLPDCLNVDACASFRYDVDLFSDPALRDVVTAATLTLLYGSDLQGGRDAGRTGEAGFASDGIGPHAKIAIPTVFFGPEYRLPRRHDGVRQAFPGTPELVWPPPCPLHDGVSGRG